MEIKTKTIFENNPYPGRGIVLGMTPDGKHMAQIYWIMGRSENSRNRIFVEENGFVKTEAFDKSKVIDPSLIIYYCSKDIDGRHIVTNGDQTDTIYEHLNENKTFEEALDTRTFEPDKPNFTPRISGIVEGTGYKLSILKSYKNDADHCIRQYFAYEKAAAGIGHCIHTYSDDGDPLPSFEGEPYTAELYDDIEKTADVYWNLLNDDNKISLLVKYISLADNKFENKIINRYK